MENGTNADATSKEEKVQTAEDYLGYPPEVAAEEPARANPPADTQTQINDILKDITVGEDGKFVYPEGISLELKAAVAATKSFRDTQGSFTKSQQALKASEAVNEELRTQLSNNVSPTAHLTPEEATKLNELKATDPDEWYKQMRALETGAGEKANENYKEVSEKASRKTELERRYGVLNSLNEGRDSAITVEMLDSEVPPKFGKELADGKITFEQYLTKAVKYIDADKVVKSPPVDPSTTLGDQTGGAPGETTPDDGVMDYEKQTF